MSFEDELRPKVDELERLARQAYDEYLDLVGMKTLQWRGGSTTVVWQPGKPDGPYESPGDVPTEQDKAAFLEQMQAQYRTFASDLLSLAELLASYYMLGTLESSLLWVSAKLGIMPDSIGTASVLSAGQGVNVRDRIDRAIDFVKELGTPGDETGFYGWQSPAADAFNDRFLNKLDEASEHQIVCTAVLAIANRAFLQGVQDAQKDLKSIVDAAIGAFEDYDAYDPRGITLTEALTGISLLATAAGIIVTGPVSAPVLGGISLASGIGSIVTGQRDARKADRQADVDPPEWTIAGSHPWELVASVLFAIRKLERQLYKEDADIAEALLLEARSTFASAELTVSRPGFVDDPGSFRDGARPLNAVVEVERLYKAGYVRLPAASAEYDAACMDLMQEPSSQDLQRLFFRGWSGYQSNRETLRLTLHDTSSALRETGGVLVAIATAYEWMDADSEAAFNRILETTAPAPPAASRPWDQIPTRGPY